MRDNYLVRIMVTREDIIKYCAITCVVLRSKIKQLGNEQHHNRDEKPTTHLAKATMEQ